MQRTPIDHDSLALFPLRAFEDDLVFSAPQAQVYAAIVAVFDEEAVYVEVSPGAKKYFLDGDPAPSFFNDLAAFLGGESDGEGAPKAKTRGKAGQTVGPRSQREGTGRGEGAAL